MIFLLNPEIMMLNHKLDFLLDALGIDDPFSAFPPPVGGLGGAVWSSAGARSLAALFCKLSPFACWVATASPAAVRPTPFVCISRP